MSVQLNPDIQLVFHRPLTTLIKRILTLTNHNDLPVAFKVKTTAPKLYCVRPNSGRIEPGDVAEVLVMLLPMKEDPPTSIKCKDKFLVQSTHITPEKDNFAIADIWAGNDDQIHQQKLKVAWVSADDETEDAMHEHPSIMTQGDDSRYETVRHIPDAVNGFAPPPAIAEPAGAGGLDPRAPSPPIRTLTPAASYHDTPDQAPVDVVVPVPAPVSVSIMAHTPPPPPSPPRASASDPSADIRLVEAQAEIQRLRALLASMPEPQTELRRRTRTISGPANEKADGKDEGAIGQEMMTDGYSPQSVAIIAFAVFLFAYLFF